MIGFPHDHCNSQVRENYYHIPVVAHNQFRFDFFLFLKGLRPTVWETADIKIGGSNPTNINFAMIQNQVRFIDTIKYFQQSLENLAASMTDIEKNNVRETSKRFLAFDLIFLDQEQQDWILDYLTSGKGIIPYQMITTVDSLETEPKNGACFDKKDFYSTLKEKDISEEEYADVKNFFKLMKMKTLGEMNKIYNIQDALILCEIFEQRSVLLQKCNIVLPTDAKKIKVFEKTLIGGYSCINTRVAFDTDIFLRDKDNERVLFKTTKGEVKRFSSKIIKMDENNQYGFAMTKPLPYGVIK